MIRQFTAIIQAIVPGIVAVHNDEHNIYPPRTAVINPLKIVVPCLSQSYGSLRAATRVSVNILPMITCTCDIVEKSTA